MITKWKIHTAQSVQSTPSRGMDFNVNAALARVVSSSLPTAPSSTQQEVEGDDIEFPPRGT